MLKGYIAKEMLGTHDLQKKPILPHTPHIRSSNVPLRQHHFPVLIYINYQSIKTFLVM